MDGTRELVDPAQVGTALAVLSGVSLVAAAVLMIAGRIKNANGLVKAALVFSAGILAYPLWVVYNSIEDHFGLDSVVALLLNLALFSVIGIVGGLALRRLWPDESFSHHGDTETRREEEATGTGVPAEAP
jgi:hypothetical protein